VIISVTFTSTASAAARLGRYHKQFRWGRSAGRRRRRSGCGGDGRLQRRCHGLRTRRHAVVRRLWHTPLRMRMMMRKSIRKQTRRLSRIEAQGTVSRRYGCCWRWRRADVIETNVRTFHTVICAQHISITMYGVGQKYSRLDKSHSVRHVIIDACSISSQTADNSLQNVILRVGLWWSTEGGICFTQRCSMSLCLLAITSRKSCLSHLHENFTWDISVDKKELTD